MIRLKPAQEFTIALLLMALMVATRFHHFGSVTHLPDASWAIFIAGGFFLRRMSLFLVFMGLAVLIDFLAITRFGVSSFCISPAYGFLLPAYAALWLGGRWLQAHYQPEWKMLFQLTAMVIVSAAAAFLISSGSFYLLSGNIGETSITGFMAQTVKYFPGFLLTTAGYVAAMAATFMLVRLASGAGDQHHPTHHA
jgi:hypothetical protein